MGVIRWIWVFVDGFFSSTSFFASRLGEGFGSFAAICKRPRGGTLRSRSIYVYYIYAELRIGDCRFGWGKSIRPL